MIRAASDPVQRQMRARMMAGGAAFFFFALNGPVLAQKLGQGSDDNISLWRVAAALLLCVALAVAGAFVLKARGGRGFAFPYAAKRSRRLQLVETLKLGHQIDLCIVNCDGHELLVASSAQNVNLLHRLPLTGELDAASGGQP